MSLNACPFCGGEFVDVVAVNETHTLWAVKCDGPGCLAQGPEETTPAAAKMSWDNREELSDE